MSPTSQVRPQDPNQSTPSKTDRPSDALRHLVIACSLSPTSRSTQMAQYLTDALEVFGGKVELLDLRALALPFCDAGTSETHEHVSHFAQKVAKAQSVTLAVPIYNYDVGGAARNLIALTGNAWTEKVVGLIGAAGGDRSFMSLMGLANSLMLDFRSVVVPRFVYASKAEFAGDHPHGEIAGRLDTLAGDLERFATAFHSVPTGVKVGRDV